MKVNNFIASLLLLIEFEAFSLGFESFELKEGSTMDGTVLKSTIEDSSFIFLFPIFSNPYLFGSQFFSSSWHMHPIEPRTEKSMQVAYLILNEDEEKILIKEKDKLKENKKKESPVKKEPEMVKEEDLSPS